MKTKSLAATARERAGFATPEAAAKRAKLTASTIQKYERGDGRSFGIAEKLGWLYGCSPFLFTRQANIQADLETSTQRANAR